MWIKGLFGLLMAITLSLPDSSVSGTIEGKTVDEQERPVAGVDVEAVPEGALLRGRVLVRTNSDGRFSISDLPLGKYKVFAMKPADFYPDTSMAFYSEHRLVRVELTKANPKQEVVLQLGPKAGLLTGAVRDAATGREIAAVFHLRRGVKQELWLKSSQPPSYEILIPSNTEVFLEVTAEGYLMWQPPKGYVRVLPTQRLELDIQLQPLP